MDCFGDNPSQSRTLPIMDDCHWVGHSQVMDGRNRDALSKDTYGPSQGYFRAKGADPAGVLPPHPSKKLRGNHGGIPVDPTGKLRPLAGLAGVRRDRRLGTARPGRQKVCSGVAGVRRYVSGSLEASIPAHSRPVRRKRLSFRHGLGQLNLVARTWAARCSRVCAISNYCGSLKRRLPWAWEHCQLQGRPYSP